MSDSGLARPYKSPGHVSLDPLIGPGRRPFRRPVPPELSTPAAARLCNPELIGSTLNWRLLNQTILECADWGQITVSYTVLPRRRSGASNRLAARSRGLAASEKHRQINFLTRFRCKGWRRSGPLLAPTARDLGEPSEELKFAGKRITCRLLVHGRTRRRLVVLPCVPAGRPWRGRPAARARENPQERESDRRQG